MLVEVREVGIEGTGHTRRRGRICAQMIGQPEVSSGVGLDRLRIELSGKWRLRQMEHECLRANLKKRSKIHQHIEGVSVSSREILTDWSMKSGFERGRRCRREWCWNLVTRSPAFREYL